MREVLEINPCQIENIRLSHIPNWDMMEPTILYRFRPVKKSDFIPICMMERVPDVDSIFTAELRVIYLVLYHGISSSGDKSIICVDLCPDNRP